GHRRSEAPPEGLRRRRQRHRRRARTDLRRLVAAARLQHPGRAGGALRGQGRGRPGPPQGAPARPAGAERHRAACLLSGGLDFFFYGTLLDDDVRAAVLGRTAPACAPVPAVLAGFRRVPVSGRSFPALIADPRGRVDGALLAGLDAAAAARLSYFEGPEYDPLLRPVVDAAGVSRDAWVFVPAPRQPF